MIAPLRTLTDVGRINRCNMVCTAMTLKYGVAHEQTCNLYFCSGVARIRKSGDFLCVMVVIERRQHNVTLDSSRTKLSNLDYGKFLYE